MPGVVPAGMSNDSQIGLTLLAGVLVVTGVPEAIVGGGIIYQCVYA